MKIDPNSTEGFCTAARIEELLRFIELVENDWRRWEHAIEMKFSLLFDEWGGHSRERIWRKNGENASGSLYLSDLTILLEVHERTKLRSTQNLTLKCINDMWFAHRANHAARAPTPELALMRVMLFNRRYDIVHGRWPTQKD